MKVVCITLELERANTKTPLQRIMDFETMCTSYIQNTTLNFKNTDFQICKI